MNNSYQGLIPGAPFETIQYAVNQTQPGDTVYVKNASTSYDRFTVKSDQITIVGHDGDINIGAAGMPDESTSALVVIPTNPRYPVVADLNPTGPDGKSVARGIDLNGHDNVTIVNFYITQCKTGIGSVGSRDCVIENVFAYYLGDRTIGGNDMVAYRGSGILLTGLTDFRTLPAGDNKLNKNNLLKNCVVYNATYSGIEFANAVENIVENCRVYADDGYSGTKSAMDYYFTITNGDGNSITDSKAERSRDPITLQPIAHIGHGFALHGWAHEFPVPHECKKNVFRKCTASNLSDVVLMRGGNVHSNWVDQFISHVSQEQETNAWNTKSSTLGCITLVTGPHHNRFSKVFSFNSDVAISFKPADSQDTFDEKAKFTDAEGELNFWAAKHNLFDNCYFLSCEVAIDMNDDGDESGRLINEVRHDLSDGGSDLDVIDNAFVFCTFDCDDYEPPIEISGYNYDNAFFYSAREASGNKVVNCLITGFDAYTTKDAWPSGGAKVHNNNSINSQTGRQFVPILGDAIVFPNGTGSSPQLALVVPGVQFEYCVFANIDPLTGEEHFPVFALPEYDYSNFYSPSENAADIDPLRKDNATTSPLPSSFFDEENGAAIPGPTVWTDDLWGFARDNNPTIGAIE